MDSVRAPVGPFFSKVVFGVGAMFGSSHTEPEEPRLESLREIDTSQRFLPATLGQVKGRFSVDGTNA